MLGLHDTQLGDAGIVLDAGICSILAALKRVALLNATKHLAFKTESHILHAIRHDNEIIIQFHIYIHLRTVLKWSIKK